LISLVEFSAKFHPFVFQRFFSFEAGRGVEGGALQIRARLDKVEGDS